MQRRFIASGFFALRTPLLPLDELTAFSAGLSAPDATEGELDAAVGRDREILCERLREAFERPELRDALYVASPSLENALAAWRPGGDDARSRKVELRLVRYLARAAGRPTPFGLFAGQSVGGVADETRLELSPRSEYRRHSRLDMDYLHALAGELARDPEVRTTLVHRPNSSLYRAAGRIRYVETRLSEGERTHHLVALVPSPHLDAALERAAGGATPSELAAAVEGASARPDDAAAYVEQLIERQVVVPDLGVDVTGAEPTAGLRDQLAATPAGEALDAVRAELDQLDRDGLGADPSRYLHVAETLVALPVEVEPSRLFQVDMTKPAPAATLGADVLDELERGAELLAAVARRDPFARELDEIREALVARFGGRPVPLAEALDDELGVGAVLSSGAGSAEPLLRGLAFPPERPETSWDARDRALLALVTEAARRGETEIQLSTADLEQLGNPEAARLPGAFSVTARLLAPADEDGFRLLLQRIDGPPGAILLGRFCHADPDLRAKVEDHLRAEERADADAAFAEIVHLPEGRLGNVIARPVLRDFEIPYLGRSGAPADRRLPVSDLLVSVEDGELRLHSQRLGRRVHPRMTSAHNFTRRSVPVYRFLCLLARQGVSGVEFDWGPLRDAPFLPRVTSGRLVLALAQWRLGADDLEPLRGRGGGDLVEGLRALRSDRGIPRRAGLAEFDNVLPVDFENVLSAESFVQLVQGREDALLLEEFEDPARVAVHGPEGGFVHELVVPFTRAAPASRDGRPAATARLVEAGRRSLAPDSEWLYAQLYTGPATADRVLAEAAAPLARDAVASEAAASWFFIRYADPAFHVRLRLHGEPAALREEVLPRLGQVAAELMQDGLVWRFTLDTYEREVERYGGPEGMLLAERIFHVDSEAVLDILELLEPGDAGAHERWMMGLAGSAALAKDLGLSEYERAELWRRLRGRFGAEFRADSSLGRQLGERLRENRGALEPLLDPATATDHPLAPGCRILVERSERLAPLVEELRMLDRSGHLRRAFPQLAEAFIHMHLNRLLRSGQRKQELVLYDFLDRLETARRARKAAREVH